MLPAMDMDTLKLLLFFITQLRSAQCKLIFLKIEVPISLAQVYRLLFTNIPSKQEDYLLLLLQIFNVLT
jgi:hypothetical protein